MSRNNELVVVDRKQPLAADHEEPRRETSRAFWLRVAHGARIAAAVGILIAGAAALTWSPTPPAGGSTALAAVPPPPPAPSAHQLAARRAVAADAAALAARLSPALAAREAVNEQVRRGDTLRDVLDRVGVDGGEAHRAFTALSDVFDARDLRAGQEVALYLEREAEDAEPRLLGLAFAPDVERTVHVARRGADGFSARSFAVPLTRRIARAQGEITESLYVDAKAAGVDDMVIAEIAQLLAYTVDFQREIREGDVFDITFEQFLDPAGEVVKTGEIYQVSFAPQGRALEFWRYEPPGGDDGVGYYNAEGESARRFLMKTPVNATRISSGFSAARRHPVLGYTRAHKGTDFAAPRGTPIYAAGNGVVERANVYGSFGNYVRIRHANGYKTIYGHLNGFARGIRAGTRVSQGEVIGYVGMTGTATGPHLHYEVHLNGTAVNPMRIDAPTGRTLNEDELTGFEVERALIDAMRQRARPANAEPGLEADELLASGAPVDHAALEPEQPSTDG